MLSNSLCVNYSKSSCTCLTALTHLSDILAVQEEGKNSVGISADGAFVLTLMESQTRKLDQVLLLPVMVEPPAKD